VEEQDWRGGDAGSAEFVGDAVGEALGSDAVGKALGPLESRVGVVEGALSPGVDDEEDLVPGLAPPDGSALDPEPVGSAVSSDMEYPYVSSLFWLIL
jgi:hypothetical protein